MKHATRMFFILVILSFVSATLSSCKIVVESDETARQRAAKKKADEAEIAQIRQQSDESARRTAETTTQWLKTGNNKWSLLVWAFVGVAVIWFIICLLGGAGVGKISVLSSLALGAVAVIFLVLARPDIYFP